MATLRYTSRALEDLNRLVDFLMPEDPAAAGETMGLIEHGLQILETHPLMGRPVEQGRRELVISRGRTGCISLYPYLAHHDRVHILAIRHQREAGFEEE